MYFYCYVYVFLLLCMFCSVYPVFIVATGTLRLPWLRFFRVFSSVVRQIPRYNSQRRGKAHTLPKLIVLFYVLFLCKWVLCRSQRPRGLRRRSAAARMLRSWVRILLGHGCLSVVSVVCRQVEVSATSWSLVQRSPTDCSASLCVI